MGIELVTGDELIGAGETDSEKEGLGHHLERFLELGLVFFKGIPRDQLSRYGATRAGQALALKIRDRAWARAKAAGRAGKATPLVTPAEYAALLKQVRRAR